MGGRSKRGRDVHQAREFPRDRYCGGCTVVGLVKRRRTPDQRHSMGSPVDRVIAARGLIRIGFSAKSQEEDSGTVVEGLRESGNQAVEFDQSVVAVRMDP